MPELREDDFAAFFDVPFRVYPASSPYVSPMKADLERFLDVEKNPLWKHQGARRVFTAHRGGAPVGRIVAHVHHASNRRHGWRRGCFGFFDCADDPEAADLLLGAAEAFAREHGCDEVMGSFNLTAMQQVGVVTDGFDAAPYTDQHYNPPHLPRLLRACGYAPEFPMSTWEVDLRALRPDALLGGAARERLADPSLRWETLRARDFARILGDIRVVLNDGFDRNPMFVPLTPEEMEFQAKDMATILDPRIAALVHDREGPAGTVVCIPDLNPLLRAMRSRFGLLTPWHFLRFRMTRKRAVIILYSVAERMQGRGLNAAMLFRVTTALKAAGYTHLGITWIADVNAASLRQVQKMGARRLHRAHLFRKALA
ncbi:MAG: GNAT family N-acetyltransferase [Gemmatimonadota bacterium]